MLLVAMCAAAVIWRTQRRVGIFCVSILVMVLGSYGFIYLVRGKSYTQLKWISFFQPLYTAVGFLVLCAAAVYLLDRIGIGPGFAPSPARSRGSWCSGRDREQHA